MEMQSLFEVTKPQLNTLLVYFFKFDNLSRPYNQSCYKQASSLKRRGCKCKFLCKSCNCEVPDDCQELPPIYCNACRGGNFESQGDQHKKRSKIAESGKEPILEGKEQDVSGTMINETQASAEILNGIEQLLHLLPTLDREVNSDERSGNQIPPEEVVKVVLKSISRLK